MTGFGVEVDMGTVPVVEARQVVKRYGATVALDHADLTVLPGQTHALVGRNGAGKSTLVSVLTGLGQPDSGSLKMNGEPAPGRSDRDAWRSLVACVYQHSTIIPDLSVAENLFLNRQETVRGFVRWSAVRRAATQLLERWSVDVDVRFYPRVSSGSSSGSSSRSRGRCPSERGSSSSTSRPRSWTAAPSPGCSGTSPTCSARA